MLEAQAEPGDGHSACYALLTQKGDLCLMHWRRDLEALRRGEIALRRAPGCAPTSRRPTRTSR